MNEERFHPVQSESEGTSTYRRFPGMETLVEMLMEENKLQQKSRSCLVATCGHKGLKVRSMRREEEEEDGREVRGMGSL